jgi:hypothetical protein
LVASANPCAELVVGNEADIRIHSANFDAGRQLRRSRKDDPLVRYLLRDGAWRLFWCRIHPNSTSDPPGSHTRETRLNRWQTKLKWNCDAKFWNHLRLSGHRWPMLGVSSLPMTWTRCWWSLSGNSFISVSRPIIPPRRKESLPPRWLSQYELWRKAHNLPDVIVPLVTLDFLLQNRILLSTGWNRAYNAILSDQL